MNRLKEGTSSPEARRDQLLSAGERLFSKYGYRGVTIAEVTAEVGVSTGSFYSHFPDKKTFFGVILDHIAEQGIREARLITNRFKSPMNQLKALYRFISLGLQKSPLLLGVLTNTRNLGFPSPAECARRRGSLLSSVAKLVNSILSDGIRRRTFRVGRFKDPGRLLVSIYGALLSELDSDYIEDLTQDMLLLMERGLRRRLSITGRTDRLSRRQVFSREYSNQSRNY